MTDEEKAEEYAKRECENRGWCDLFIESESRRLKQAYLAGLEEGRKLGKEDQWKATEKAQKKTSAKIRELEKENTELKEKLKGFEYGKPKWHNLRKDPQDLPDGGRQVIVADKSINGYDIACFCRNGKSGFWSYERFISHIEDNYVLAWCDFTRFEEKEE